MTTVFGHLNSFFLLKERVHAYSSTEDGKMERLFQGLYKRMDMIMEILEGLAEQKEAKVITNLSSCSTPTQPKVERKPVCIIIPWFKKNGSKFNDVCHLISIYLGVNQIHLYLLFLTPFSTVRDLCISSLIL